jgi:hypothetical protein
MNLRQQILQDRSEALAALRVLRGRASKLLTRVLRGRASKLLTCACCGVGLPSC